MQLILELEKTHLKLSKAEALAKINPKNYQLDENLLILETSSKSYIDLAYTKNVYQLNYELENLPTKIYVLKIKKAPNPKKLYEKIKGIKVDLTKPKQEIFLIGANKTYEAKRIWTRPSFETRRAHLRQAKVSTSMHPKMARAMVNLAKSNKIIDPFCGAGGILIEGLLTNKEVIGIDIDLKTLNKAKQNTSHLKGNKTFKNVDSTKIAINDTIVTDPPYGRASKATDNTKKLIETILHNSNSKRAIICMPKEIKPQSTKYKEEESFDIYTHKSLTRTIRVYNSLILE